MAKKKKVKTMEDARQQELHELIELKKMRQQAAENPETDVLPQPEKIVPKTFKEKWDNYWYHYKGTTWGTLLAVLLVAWLIKDVFFAPQPDMVMNVATATKLGAVNPNMEDDLKAYIEDYNEDGKVLISLGEMPIDNISDPEMLFANHQKLIATIAAGDGLIYVLDQQAYDMIFEGSGGDYSMFINMEKLYPGLDIAKGDKLYIDDLPFGKKWKLDRFEDRDFFVCVRFLGNSARDNEKNQESLKNVLSFVQTIITEQYPEWEGNQPVYDPLTMNT